MRDDFWNKDRADFQIARIAMENFRCFSGLALELNFEPRKISRNGELKTVSPLTVIVAKNGMGKTTILDAIRIAYGTFTSEFSYKSSVTFHSRDIRIDKDKISQCFPATIDALGDIDKSWYEWIRTVRKEGQHTRMWVEDKEKENATDTLNIKEMGGNPFKTFIKKFKEAEEWKEILTLPIIASYGTNRLWKKTNRKEKKRNLVTDRTWGYSSCLDAASNYSESFEWLTDSIIVRLNEKQVGIQKNQTINDLLDAIESALKIVLEPEGYTPPLHLDPFFQELAVVQGKEWGKGISVPVSQMSDGVKAVFFMVADIAFRCAKLNPQFKKNAAELTPGIVLIDEIDLHLHPSWQQSVLDTLQLAFPKIQFIVTTHSPQVVSSVPKECVRIIDNGEVIPFSTPTQGVDISDILAGIFGTDPIPQNSEIAKKLNLLHTMLAEGLGDSAEWNALYQELETYYGKDYPPLLGTKAHREFLKKMKAGECNA